MDSNYITDNVHISTIRGGDTVIHNGEIKSVCPNNIKYDSFMGHSLFGDSYRLGNILVKKVTFRGKA